MGGTQTVIDQLKELTAVSVIVDNTQRAVLGLKEGRIAALAVLIFFSGVVGAAEIRVLPVQQPESGKVFAASSATIYFEVLGGAEARGARPATPLIVVNGGPGFDHNYLHCSKAWDEIARARPVVFYDQRGNGRSPGLKRDQTCTLADQIQDLDDLRANLGYERVNVLGHSWGGYLAMAYAARHPERIDRLIVCDSAAPKWDDTEFLFKYVFPERLEQQDGYAFADQLGDKTASDSNIKIYLGLLFYSEEKRDLFIAGASNYHYSKEINTLLNSDLKRFDLNPELRKFHFPTLVITGRYDMNVAPSTAFRIHRQISWSEFLVFEKSGHLPFYEEPEKFAGAITRFLSGP